MEQLDAEFRNLNFNSRPCIGCEEDHLESATRDEIPFRPPGQLADQLYNTPRYLFRVFSEATLGENTNEWVKSGDAVEGRLTDIFARNDDLNVAITLNEHLRWSEPKSGGDPFMSWTTSLLFAIQHAIYKHKIENVELRTIQVCIVDTAMFRRGVFLRDLYLIEEFEDKIPGSQWIKSENRSRTWKYGGLPNLRTLRGRQRQGYSGFYYFGEYLSQGQMKIKGRSCIVSCDKIVNSHLFTLAPSLGVELRQTKSRWANAVVELREPFYRLPSPTAEATEVPHLIAAVKISLNFETHWILPMFANLLALSPRRAQDLGILGVIICALPSDARRRLFPQETMVIADHTIPEVLQFDQIMRDIKEDAQTPHQLHQIVQWLSGIEKNYLAPLLQALTMLIDVMAEDRPPFEP
ncbi:hypothetical protein F4824DRAFT_425229 [Ustulina deusta]|nr:hypothetical protein F4824DRAFT_425229 [Ustulina deusta]